MPLVGGFWLSKRLADFETQLACLLKVILFDKLVANDFLFLLFSCVCELICDCCFCLGFRLLLS